MRCGGLRWASIRVILENELRLSLAADFRI